MPNIVLPWGIDVVPIFILFFIYGKSRRIVWLQDGAERNIGGSVMILAILYIGLVFLNGFSNVSVSIYGRWGWLSVPVFFVSSCLFMEFIVRLLKYFEKSWIVAFFATIGSFSLLLMCAQFLIFTCLNVFISKIGWNDTFYSIMATVTVFPICYGLAMLFRQLSARFVIFRYMY